MQVPLGRKFRHVLTEDQHFSPEKLIQDMQAKGSEVRLGILTSKKAVHVGKDCNRQGFRLCSEERNANQTGRLLMRANMLQVGLIIDLTNSWRYYDLDEVTDLGVEHVKIRCKGRGQVCISLSHHPSYCLLAL